MFVIAISGTGIVLIFSPASPVRPILFYSTMRTSLLTWDARTGQSCLLLSRIEEEWGERVKNESENESKEPGERMGKKTD